MYIDNYIDIDIDIDIDITIAIDIDIDIDNDIDFDNYIDDYTGGLSLTEHLQTKLDRWTSPCLCLGGNTYTLTWYL